MDDGSGDGKAKSAQIRLVCVAEEDDCQSVLREDGEQRICPHAGPVTSKTRRFFPAISYC